ncbi:hypothetical protein RM697_05495 [Ichthyenterobacterium sp. W332]|uniref:Uncharacterized protein n=1 Tax=Microcosmobacter mediterraneus TaxID=3075607 RepID=A0ABU2YLZ9_9FLAO|nr:hypothetical protein [Ichthyenterobacterium sp. W332]MDT0558088.1 hypothetical protein [Ichthyenterobacterium sp. W332]
MKKLKTSGCLFSKSESINGNKNSMEITIFNNVITIKRLKMSVLPEEYL